MKKKYSPIKFNEHAKTQSPSDTVVNIINDNSLRIDGETYEFDTESVQFPDIHTQTDGIILEAHRDDNSELYVTVRRFYTSDCASWDNGEYNEINR